MNPLQANKVFFIGVGGIGISAIARLFLLQGKQVHGSDMAKSEITDELEKLGAHIKIGQGFSLIPKDVELVVYTTAIKHYDPNLMEEIKNSGIFAKSYPEMLHSVTNDKSTIAVSGTHGKTTTTAMIAKVLIDAHKDPSVIVGSLLKDYKSNLIVGKSDHFVVEACEYERSFLNIIPKILVITNIEADHLDYYKDLNDIENAFNELSMQTTAVVVCDPSDPSIAHAIKNISASVIDYTKYISKIHDLSVPGIHNIKNAACALAVAEYLGVDEKIALSSLQKFGGTWRRLEKIRETANGVIVYDDYAHHPTEIRASLLALREMYPHGTKKITVVFQPHLYSRTKALFDGFTTAFTEADSVYFLPIYFARENPDPSVSSEILAEAVSNHVPNTRAFLSFEEAEEYFKNAGLGDGDVFVTMGAGEAYRINRVL